MQEVYAALMLHENGQPVNVENVKKILESAGTQVDDARIKALVASLEGVNIDDALKEAVSFAAQPVATGEKKEEKTGEEEEKAAESASAGLSSLFG